MFGRASILALLVIFVCDGEAIYKHYDRILESPEYKEMLILFAPEKMLTNYNVYADDEALLNTRCRRELIILNDAIARRESWALTMLDVSSKLPSGILRGNIIDLGHYDECLAIHTESSDYDIHGRHCMYSISTRHGTITLPTNPSLSICLPATCSAGDIVSFFNATTFSSIDMLKDLQVKILSATCTPVDTSVWDVEFTAWLIILGSFVTFLIACTVIEMSAHRQKIDTGLCRRPFVDTLAMFSLRKSAALILNMEVKKGTLPAIDGIRCLSMASIVLFHQYNLSPEGTIVNLLDFYDWAVTWKSTYIFVTLFSVDTFFAVSGFLMTYLFLKQMPKQKEFNVPMYYLHRYLRLTPAVLALMIITVVFIPKLGSGTRWDTALNPYINSCRSNWWPPLLYIQNFVNKENYCLHHLWYLAVDMQLFWVSPLILYPLYKKPKYGLILLSALLVSCLIISASVIGIKELPVLSFHQLVNSTIRRRVFMESYEIPYQRAAPWLVGIFVGYEVAIHDRRLNKWSATAGWLVTIASFVFCILGKRSFVDPDYEYNVVWETFFSVVSKPIWALGICWIIYASIKNQAGFLSTILSFRIFLPLSRLSYGVYLAHFVLLTIHNADLKTPEYFSEYYVWRSFFNTLMLSIAVAFLLNLFFESPIMVLEKLLKRKPKHQLQKNHTKKVMPSIDEKSEPQLLSTELSSIDHSTTKTNSVEL